MYKDEDIDYWDTDNAEMLYYNDKDEAIREIIGSPVFDMIPDNITICGYKRIVLPEATDMEADALISRIIEDLDEKYGNPDWYSDITEEMTEITKKYLNDIYKLYTPWLHEIVKTEVIDVQKWLASKRERLILTKNT